MALIRRRAPRLKIYRLNDLGEGERIHNKGLVAQWITRLTTDQKIPGSNPGKVGFFISLPISTPAEKK